MASTILEMAWNVCVFFFVIKEQSGHIFILVKNNYGNEMNRVCLFLKTERKHVPRFWPETNIYNFHNYNKITKDVLSSFS